MDRSRAARGVLATGAAAFVLGILVSSRAPGPRAWALHLPGFLPGPERFLVLGLLVVGAALLILDLFVRERPPASGRVPRGGGPRPKKGTPRASGNRLRWAWLLILPWAWLLWRLQTRTRFLGDGTVWLDNIRSGNPAPFSEPLAAALWGWFAHALTALRLPIDPVTAGLLPILCGAVALPLFWGIASEIAPASRAAACAVLVTMGVAQLYFGYIESYPIVSVAMLAYLWLGLRCDRGADPPWWCAAALTVTIGCHLACLFLAPSFLYLVLRRAESWANRAILAAAPFAGAAALLILLGYPPSRWIGAFRIVARAIEPGHEAALVKPYGPLSLDHGWDLLNALLLAMPIPVLLLLAGLAGGLAMRAARSKPEQDSTERTRDPIGTFLLLAALPGALLAAALVLPVAPAQDWDLTSILFLPLGILGVRAGFTIPGVSMTGRRLAGILALGAGALLSFVMVNAREDSATRRFETLLGPNATITAYGRSYGNELLQNHDVARRDFSTALVHAQRALDAEPTNPRYWIKKGATLYELGRYDEAIPVLQEGIRRGPHRDDGYYNLGNCLARKGRYPEAAVYFREALQRGGPKPDYLNNLGVALFHSGARDSARVVWLNVLRRYPGYERSRGLLVRYFGSADSAGAAR